MKKMKDPDKFIINEENVYLYNRYNVDPEKQSFYEEIHVLKDLSAINSGDYFDLDAIQKTFGEGIIFRKESGDDDYYDSSQIIFYRPAVETDEMYRIRMFNAEETRKREESRKEKALKRASKTKDKRYQKYLELQKEFG